MLKFLSKVRIEFNALDPRTACCLEFLAQCNARKAKESNPACQLMVKRRTDDHPPQITVTYVNGVEEVIDATSTSAQTLRTRILEKGQYLETEQMFREAGETWPVIIPEDELHQRHLVPRFWFNSLSTSARQSLAASWVLRKYGLSNLGRDVNKRARTMGLILEKPWWLSIYILHMFVFVLDQEVLFFYGETPMPRKAEEKRQ